MRDELAAIDDSSTPARVASELRLGLHVSDQAFDRFLPRELRFWSSAHWTPLAAALRAAEWLDAVGVRTVVDIGSGAGKFCVATALTSRARFIGVEHRRRFVEASRELARAFDVEDRVSFVHAAFGSGPVIEADAYYLFNPFAENRFRAEHQLDADVELDDVRYVRDVAAVERLLRDAPVGTYLLTYNGFGGKVPTGYAGVRVDRKLRCVLRMWQKKRPLPARPPE